MSHSLCRVSILILIPGMLSLTSNAFAAPTITVTPIVIEGDNVPEVGNITSGFGACENMTINDNGTWLVESDTTNPNLDIDGVILLGTGTNPGVLYLQHGQNVVLPASATISSFDSLKINNDGNSSFNHNLDGTGGTNNDAGVYYNDMLLIQEGMFSAAAGFSPDTRYVGFFETRINILDQLLMVATVDDPAIASTVDRALVIIDNASGPFVETVVVKEGDAIIPGRLFTDCSTGSHHCDLNDSGHVLFLADVDGATTDDTAVVVWDGSSFVIKAREGDPCPAVPGRNWATLTDKPVDQNNLGDWVIRAQLNTPTTDDVLIVKNGTEVIAREGSSLPSIGGVFTFTAFGTGAVAIDDSGNVFWYGDWNDPDTTRDTGLFMNDQLIVQEGVTLTTGGNVIKSISGVESNFGISNNGRWLIFEGVLNDDRDGAILVEIAEANGDLNCDNETNGLDVAAFALAVIDPGLFATTHAGCNILNGDFNGDALTNGEDVTEFVETVLGP